MTLLDTFTSRHFHRHYGQKFCKPKTNFILIIYFVFCSTMYGLQMYFYSWLVLLTVTSMFVTRILINYLLT